MAIADAHSTLLFVPVLAAVAAYGLTWLARLVAPRLGFVDRPDGGRKRHSTTTPMLGGIAVFAAFVIAILASGAVDGSIFEPEAGVALGPLVASGALFCLLGLWDDLRSLRARDKLLYQMLASLPFAIWGPSVEYLHFLGFSVQLGPLGILFTIFWLVSCANVVNLVDGLDGLATTLGLIVMLTFALLSLLSQRLGVVLVSAFFAGSLIGFLIHNWPPAKIFLGDAGSLTIGFLVGALSIEASLKTPTGFMLAFPLVVLSIPILDTSMAILRRRLAGRPIGDPDRKHIHHLLQDRGLSKLQTLLAIAGLTLAMAAATIAGSVYQAERIAVFICVSVLGLLVFGRVFGFHELGLVFRHIKLVHSVLSDTVGMLGSRSLLVRLEHAEMDDRDALWDEVGRRVAALGGAQLTFSCRSIGENAETAPRALSAPAGGSQQAASWQFQYAIKRGESQQTTISVKGCSSKDQRFEELIRVCDTLCRYWPLDAESQSYHSMVMPLESAESGTIAEPELEVFDAHRSKDPDERAATDQRKAA